MNTIVHLVKLHELTEKEKILVAENSPVWGQETQTHVLLSTNLLIAL
jgi:hypothetical protein